MQMAEENSHSKSRVAELSYISRARLKSEELSAKISQLNQSMLLLVDLLIIVFKM